MYLTVSLSLESRFMVGVVRCEDLVSQTAHSGECHQLDVTQQCHGVFQGRMGGPGWFAGRLGLFKLVVMNTFFNLFKDGKVRRPHKISYKSSRGEVADLLLY